MAITSLQGLASNLPVTRGYAAAPSLAIIWCSFRASRNLLKHAFSYAAFKMANIAPKSRRRINLPYFVEVIWISRFVGLIKIMVRLFAPQYIGAPTNYWRSLAAKSLWRS
jgi:hypothetical protein